MRLIERNKVSYCNKTPVMMYNFSNEDYLELLREIILFFEKIEYFGFDDTVIRFDDDINMYVATVYVLDDEEYLLQ